VWKRSIGRQVLTFHLAGINNQNFLMRDEETGSFWQQVSGKAVSGPMKGQQLELVRSDELTFAQWRKEIPNGAVLQPVAEFEKQYESKDWDVKMQKVRTVVDTKATGIEPRRLMLGIELEGTARAFPLDTVLQQKLVQDRVGSATIFLVVGPDGKSIRAFRAPMDTEFFRKDDGSLLDQSGNAWDFRGCTTDNRCLDPIYILRDYWFDWQLYHPATTVYKR
jgi:hypothetical protein